VWRKLHAKARQLIWGIVAVWEIVVIWEIPLCPTAIALNPAIVV